MRELEQRLAHITHPVTMSIVGCVVNGPGEARETDIGFTGGGTIRAWCIFRATRSQIAACEMIDHLVQLVEDRVRCAGNRKQGLDNVAG